jgi:choline monooxygenase
MNLIHPLKPAEQLFTDDPQGSYTMASRYYTSGDIYEQEKVDIFWQSWVYVGHASQIQNFGDYITANVHGQQVMVVRDKDGELGAFFNVCPHRGHQLLEGCGNKKVIVCPYHAWCFDQKGTFIRGRNLQDLKGFSQPEFNLKPVKLELFLGFVFVNLNPNAAPMSEVYGELAEEVKHYVPQVDQLQHQYHADYTVAANWKLLIDNFLECYHCNPAHKDFVDLVDMPSYETKTYDHYSSHISHRPCNSNSKAFKVEGEQTFGYAAWFMWPNLTIWVMPGEANISMLQMHPDGLSQCLETLDWYGLGDEMNQASKEAITYLDEVLQPEDIGLCESVQKGLNSLSYNQGRFVVDNDRSHLSEHGVHHFQQLVVKALAKGD